MKDERGLYYYPSPLNKKVRMYVKRLGSEFYFRMWNKDDEALWEEHGWVPYGAIMQAAAMYDKKNSFDPKKAYDIEAAKILIEEDKR